jgi:hypothetical protein
MEEMAASLSREPKPVKIGAKNKSKRENKMRIRIIALSAGLILIAGAAMAQSEAGASAGAARSGAVGNPAASANAIKPGSMIVAHGQNGFGATYPYPDLYRGNGGNGLYGPTTGAYFGQFEQNSNL